LVHLNPESKLVCINFGSIKINYWVWVVGNWYVFFNQNFREDLISECVLHVKVFACIFFSMSDHLRSIITIISDFITGDTDKCIPGEILSPQTSWQYKWSLLLVDGWLPYSDNNPTTRLTIVTSQLNFNSSGEWQLVGLPPHHPT
jgi:hypothetical protein